MKICMIKSVGGDPFISEYFPFHDVDNDSYVRVSEIVEVELKPLRDDEAIGRQLAQIDRKEQEIREKFQEALNAINADRQNLLALPNRA